MKYPFSLRFLVAALAAFVLCGTAGAITLGQADDFQDGTTQAWVANGINPNPPDVLPGAGPDGAGDFALRIRTNGEETGAGSKLLGRNLTQWTGDYTAAGVTGISVDLNSPNNVPLNVRFAVRGPGGDFATPDVVVPAGTGVWNNFVFSLEAANLIYTGFGTPDADATLANVGELRLLHNPLADHRGAPVSSGGRAGPFAGSLLADNLTAVPEPGTAALALAGGLALLRRR